MGLEVLAAILLAGLVLWLILDPLQRPEVANPSFVEPDDPDETPKGIALIALKEIDFDRATGKLSDEDHAVLKERYSREALAAMQAEDARRAPSSDHIIEQLVADRVAVLRGETTQGQRGLICPLCGPRPEADARFCSSCGLALFGGDSGCATCHAPIDPGSRFCGSCGSPVGG